VTNVPGENELAQGFCLHGYGQAGLSSEEAAERLRKFGPNVLGTHRVCATAVLLRQVRNPILVLLLGAALVSGLTGGGTNALIIAMIVALSIGLGFFNEYRAEVAMAAHARPDSA
jgi:P-type Mg2+ transporter